MEKVRIVYEDDQILVLYKPAGITTTRENAKVNSLEDWVMEQRSNDLGRAGIAHRLDLATSGLVVVAKTEKALEFFKKQFKNRLVEKKYWALVEGEVPFEGEVNMPIGRHRFGFAKYGVREDGKNAITRFWRIDKFRRNGKIYSMLEVRLLTGRTHQIRVHLSYLGWPIVGDRVYGRRGPGGLDRLFLEAYKIRIKRPGTSEFLEQQIDLDDELKREMEGYEKI
ncbi:MAG: RluA family pseudouridine synthase [Candidatus Shapirobacteria bacterium]|jgi:23S rRNA pseudouridine1911/1915/1917 synthase